VTIDVRITKPDEYRSVSRTVAAALMFPPHDDAGWELSRPSWDESVSLSAWDGDRCVGSAVQFDVHTTVPGGAQLPTGAVSRVGVLPTHRRLGVATRLMHGLIADASARRLALMSLRASEAVIYGRYGFGVAGEFAQVTIDPARARPIAGAGRGGRFRLLAPDTILATVGPVYDACAGRRPGLITRPDSFWRRYFRDATDGSKSSYVVVHTAPDGSVDGYAHYDMQWNEPEGVDGGKGQVHEVIATSEATELALWAYLMEIDLVRSWTAEERPLDDLVKLACADSRAYTVKALDDEQWLRIVDVEAALQARTFNAATGSVVIAVEDPLIEANNKAWRISATGSEPTTDNPDLRCGIAELSATYLGGTGWYMLDAVGAIEVDDPAAVTVADNLFASRPLPFCGSFF
jgi:predicted acetyltransferase